MGYFKDPATEESDRSGVVMEIKISAKAFAQFVVGGPSKKSTIVRTILKPRSPEAIIPQGYYKPAIGIIRAYHDRNNDSSYVSEQLKALFKEAETATTSQARAKRLSNMRAVELYMKSFSGKLWKVVGCPKIHFSSSDVRISGTPDLAIKDGGRMRLVKLGVRKEKEPKEMVRIMLRVIYQAAKAKLAIATRDVTYFDVKTGAVIPGEPTDSYLAKSIENGCIILRQLVQAKPA
jgi:hypothetical protein